MINISAPVLGNDEIQAVMDVLKSGMLAQGPKVEEFEEAFASYIGTKYAIATNSGTAALHIALLASAIGKGDEIITTSFSFIASTNAILFCGAKPVFVDIDENTFNINPKLIREKITPRTKAILPVHLYGQPCDMKEIVKLCDEHSLTLVEDACQAHGAEYQGKKVGSFGIGCFSFYPTKNMTAGEGGMITTDSEDIAEKARMIRNHGQKERYSHEILGYNYRMTDITAALGICQLRKLDEFNRKRIENAKFLTGEISNIKGLIPPFIAANVKHVFHQYTVRVIANFGVSRHELREGLQRNGIVTGIHYLLPIHRQPLFRDFGYDDLPVSEKAASDVTSLPIHPSLTQKDLQYMVESIRSCKEIM